jgi:hypothetical protein
MQNCLHCGSEKIKKNGTRRGLTRYFCRACEKYSTEDPIELPASNEAIAVPGVSETEVIAPPPDKKTRHKILTKKTEEIVRQVKEPKAPNPIRAAIAFNKLAPEAIAKLEEMVQYDPFQIVQTNFYWLQTQMQLAYEGVGEPFNADEKKVLGLMQVLLDEEEISQVGYDRIRLKLMNLDVERQANVFEKCANIASRAVAVKREGDTAKQNEMFKQFLAEILQFGDRDSKMRGVKLLSSLRFEAGIDPELLNNILLKLQKEESVDTEAIATE